MSVCPWPGFVTTKVNGVVTDVTGDVQDLTPDMKETGNVVAANAQRTSDKPDRYSLLNGFNNPATADGDLVMRGQLSDGKGGSGMKFAVRLRVLNQARSPTSGATPRRAIIRPGDSSRPRAPGCAGTCGSITRSAVIGSSSNMPTRS